MNRDTPPSPRMAHIAFEMLDFPKCLNYPGYRARVILVFGCVFLLQDTCHQAQTLTSSFISIVNILSSVPFIVGGSLQAPRYTCCDMYHKIP